MLLALVPRLQWYSQYWGIRRRIRFVENLNRDVAALFRHGGFSRRWDQVVKLRELVRRRQLHNRV